MKHRQPPTPPLLVVSSSSQSILTQPSPIQLLRPLRNCLLFSVCLFTRSFPESFGFYDSQTLCFRSAEIFQKQVVGAVPLPLGGVDEIDYPAMHSRSTDIIIIINFISLASTIIATIGGWHCSKDGGGNGIGRFMRYSKG